METFYLCVVVFLAGLLQGFTGFGSVLLALPLLALFLDVKTAVPLMAMAGLLLNAFLVIPLRRHLAWKKIRPLLAGSIPGVPCGVYLLRALDGRAIMLLLGAVLLLYGLYGLVIWTERRTPPRAPREGWAYLLGFLAGALGGGFSTPGPPVIVYTSMQPWTKDEIKATLQGFFLISGVLIVLAQAASGLVTPEALHYFYVSILPILAGTWLGHFFYGKIPEIVYRRVVFIMLILLGLFTIWKSFS